MKVSLRYTKTALAALSGTLLFLACATFDIWPLAWVGLLPLFWVLSHPDTRRPLFYGFVCGLLANAGGFYWIMGFLERFGHLPAVVAAPIFLLLVAYQAITFVLFAWALFHLRRYIKISIVWLAPVVYVAIELLVPYVFPWYLAITQAWVRPVIQIAEWTGPLGVSFLLVLSNALLFETWTLIKQRQRPARRQLTSLAGALGVLVLVVVYGYIRIAQVETRREDAPRLKIGLVQANIGIHEKWVPELRAKNLALHHGLSQQLEQRGADLIVWPESSYPYYFYRDQTTDWPTDDVRRVHRDFSRPLLLGSLTASKHDRYPYNTAMLIDKNDRITGLYDKNILMVFGEYVPYYEQMRWIEHYLPEVSNTSRGQEAKIFELEHSGQNVKLGPMICYEDIFPSFGRRLARLQPNVLVNITNDAWFGRTSEPYEHLALSVFRAVELRLDLVRAVNTGVSAFVDSTGRVYQASPSVDPDELPPPQSATLLDDVRIQTAQLLYAYVGESFGGLCLIFLLGWTMLALRRAGRPILWPVVGWGALIFAMVGSAILLFLGGWSSVELGVRVLSHANTRADEAEQVFSTVLKLIPALVGAAWLTGRALRRKWPGQTIRLETGTAVALLLTVPPLLWGSLEGGEAGLVLSVALCVAIAVFAVRRPAAHSS